MYFLKKFEEYSHNFTILHGRSYTQYDCNISEDQSLTFVFDKLYDNFYSMKFFTDEGNMQLTNNKNSIRVLSVAKEVFEDFISKHDVDKFLITYNKEEEKRCGVYIKFFQRYGYNKVHYHKSIKTPKILKKIGLDKPNPSVITISRI
jgi:hypothetical protein